MADVTPHTHELELRQAYQHSHEGPWHVQYGDTKVHLWFSGNHMPKVFWKRRVNRAIAKAIRKHDTGSVKLGEREQTKTLVDTYNEKLLHPPAARGYEPRPRNDAWASDLLKK